MKTFKSTNHENHLFFTVTGFDYMAISLKGFIWNDINKNFNYYTSNTVIKL
jgi:hypothetical protein